MSRQSDGNLCPGSVRAILHIGHQLWLTRTTCRLTKANSERLE